MRIVDGTPLTDTELAQLDAHWRAANYLSVGQIYLMGNPLLREPLEPRARQAAAARPLGHHARAEPALHAPDPDHRGPRPGGHLRHRARPRRAGPGRQRLAGGHLQRDRTRGCPATSAAWRGCSRQFSFPGGVPVARGTGDARLDPRGRRARLLAVARVRRRAGQPGPGRRLRHRRRRGRDRAAGRVVALQQVPRPGRRRRGAADPAPQRLQDRQPDRARPHRRRRADRAADRLRLPAVPGRRATTRPRCTSCSPPPWTRSSTRSPRSSTAPASTASPTGHGGR